MKTYQRLFTILAFIFIANQQMNAQIGGYAGSYLTMVPGTRAQGMGGAFVAAANDVTAGFWNPAGLGILKDIQIGFMWTSLSLDRQYNYAAFAIPVWNKGTISLSYLNYHVGGIELRDETSTLKGEFSNDEHTVLVSYGLNLNRYISVGSTAKFLFHDLAEYSAVGMGYDIGLQVFPSERITLGAAAQNINSSIRWMQKKENFTKSTKIGIKYCALWNLNICFDYEYFNLPNKNWSILIGQFHKLHIGGEYIIANKITLRAGLDHDHLTMGFSLPILKSAKSLDLGYGFTNDPVDGNYVHKLEISFKIQASYTSNDNNDIPGTRIFAAKIIELYEMTLCVDIGEEHGLKEGMEVTVYKKEVTNESSDLVCCKAQIIKVQKREATLLFVENQFLSNLIVGHKVAVVYYVDEKEEKRIAAIGKK